MKKISIIVAFAKNFAIGKNNQLLWHIPDDLKRVKKLTVGNVIVMGKKTYLSLPKKPLPERTNIVISDNKNDIFEGCIMAYSFNEAVEKMSHTHENFIFGGASIYNQFFPLATKLYITCINKNFEADTFFPQIDFNDWKELQREDFEPDEKNNFSYSYVIYIRK